MFARAPFLRGIRGVCASASLKVVAGHLGQAGRSNRIRGVCASASLKGVGQPLGPPRLDVVSEAYAPRPH